MKRIFLSFIAASLFFVSCKKESASSYNSTVKAELSVEFDNVAGSQDLQLNTGKYITASGDTISSITKLKYFVSNFSFTNVMVLFIPFRRIVATIWWWKEIPVRMSQALKCLKGSISL